MAALLSVSGMSYFLPRPPCIKCTVCADCAAGPTYIIWSVYNLQAHKIITFSDDGSWDLGSWSVAVAAGYKAAGMMSW